ncbi:MAG: Asp23/Gls24 family envelope stress response protein [Ruminococcus sp.]|nr:Asp23/Gls24 family envelope stress response protein [Ruminococcus sp.]
MSQINVNLSKSLSVSEDVIAGVITNALKEIEGVCGIAPSAKTFRQFILNEKNHGDITVETVDDVLSVSVGVELESGAKAVAAAEKIQEKIKSSVQNMLGLTVAKVNVTVRSVKNIPENK